MKKYAIYCVILIGTFFAGYYTNPVLSEHTSKKSSNFDISKDRIEERVIIRSEIVRPDGTKEKRVETRNRSEDRKSASREKQISVTEKKDYGRPQWGIGVYSSIDKKGTLIVDRRIFGNIFVGGYGRIDPRNPRDYELGVGLRLEF